MGAMCKYFAVSRPLCRKLFFLFTVSVLLPVRTLPPTPSPKGRWGFLRPILSTISQTRKLFMKVCANWALSLQIFLISSILVRGLLIVNDISKNTACSRCDTGSTFQTIDEIQRV